MRTNQWRHQHEVRPRTEEGSLQRIPVPIMAVAFAACALAVWGYRLCCGGSLARCIGGTGRGSRRLLAPGL